jgi:hypothetical protein
MSSDQGERLPEAPRLDFTLPRVVDVQIRPTVFVPARRRNITSSLSYSDDAVEFIVRTDRPIPIRALGPALYVGDTAVVEATEVGENTYRFVAPTRAGLEAGAPIGLGWTGLPPGEEGATDFRFELETGASD